MIHGVCFAWSCTAAGAHVHLFGAKRLLVLISRMQLALFSLDCACPLYSFDPGLLCLSHPKNASMACLLFHAFAHVVVVLVFIRLCVSVSLSVSVSVCVSVCFCVCLCLRLCLVVCPSVRLSVCVFVSCPFARVSVLCLFVACDACAERIV